MEELQIAQLRTAEKCICLGVVLVDTSGSMDRVKDQLHEGLVALAEALDDQARGRVEFCVISFDDDARILVPFGPAYDFEAPRLDCDGMTAMHAAVELGLSELEARKDQYKANQTAYYRPLDVYAYRWRC